MPAGKGLGKLAVYELKLGLNVFIFSGLSPLGKAKLDLENTNNFNLKESSMNTTQPQVTKMKKFVIREVETLKTTAAAAYSCWLCNSCW
jgi:hypothetical protein